MSWFLFYIGISYEDVLQKPPDLNDVFDLMRTMSALWYDIGRELNIPFNDRKTLLTDASMSNDYRLEHILTNWIRSESKDVTWKVLLEALEALGRRDVVKKVVHFLEEPETYQKYILKDDFPCEYNK